MKLRRVLTAVLAPAFALVLAILISSLALLLIHQNPLNAFTQMVKFGIQPDSLVFMVDSATQVHGSMNALMNRTEPSPNRTLQPGPV